jgi:hypothetical protein
LRAQQFVFQHTGADEDKLRSEFRILGYNARWVSFISQHVQSELIPRRENCAGSLHGLPKPAFFCTKSVLASMP